MTYTADNPFRVFSFGGGWQSVAAVVLQAQGKMKPYDLFVFASVGYDSEPETHDYLNQVLMPYAARHGIECVTTSRDKGLLEALRSDTRSVQIPVYMANGAPGRRTCTTDWKIRQVDRFVRRLVTPNCHVEIGLGFSMDEQERCRPERQQWHAHEQENAKRPRPIGFNKRNTYPLLTEVEKPIWRTDIPAIIESAGLPVPPKSACWYCPFSSRTRWIEMRRNNPARFAEAVALERRINEKRELLGRDPVYLHSSLAPLEQAVGDQPPLFDFETGGGCQSGVCFT